MDSYMRESLVKGSLKLLKFFNIIPSMSLKG